MTLLPGVRIACLAPGTASRRSADPSSTANWSCLPCPGTRSGTPPGVESGGQFSDSEQEALRQYDSG